MADEINDQCENNSFAQIPPDKEFLNSEDRWLFEEMKFIHKIMADAESTYGKWEAWFIVAENILSLMTVFGTP